MLASSGEISPPCGVPASGVVIAPSSRTPAFNHLPITVIHMTRLPGVLVVDNTPALGEILARGLGESGFRVWTADNGGEAVRVLQANVGDIDAALIDLQMPSR